MARRSNEREFRIWSELAKRNRLEEVWLDFELFFLQVGKIPVGKRIRPIKRFEKLGPNNYRLEPWLKQYKIEGEKGTLWDWGKRFNILPSVIWARLARGETIEQAVCDCRPTLAPKEIYEYDGQTMSLRQWCRSYDMRYASVKGFIEKGYPFAAAMRFEPPPNLKRILDEKTH